jgi:hypothetical protein
MNILYEGVFRKPRLWSNQELRKIAPMFSGSVINVSGWRDLDKEVGYKQYLFGDYDGGSTYESYFENADEYFISNYPDDNERGFNERANSDLSIDLEEDIPQELIHRFDVVYNHTTLEHVFHVKKAFGNLCKMSRDIVILVLPFMQRVHDYQESYGDYWRFTPFAVDKMFQENGFTVIYRSSNESIQSSIYYFYVASRHPEDWRDSFEEIDTDQNIGRLNTGDNIPIIASVHLRLERLMRTLARLIKLR